MPTYEYKVIPAPKKGLKGKGVKGVEARFSNALEIKMNDMAAEGWEYQRAETLPSIERSGLTSSTTEWRNVLVFRRPRENDAEAFAPELLPAPAAVAPIAVAATALGAEIAPVAAQMSAEPEATPVVDEPETAADQPEESDENVTEDAAETTVDAHAKRTAENDNINVSFGEPSTVINSDKSKD